MGEVLLRYVITHTCVTTQKLNSKYEYMNILTMQYRDVHLRGIVGTDRIVSWTYLVPRYPKLVKTCDLRCFLPDTDNISPNLGRNIDTETVKTVKIQIYEI